jgi:hypothetical protein
MKIELFCHVFPFALLVLPHLLQSLASSVHPNDPRGDQQEEVVVVVPQVSVRARGRLQGHGRPRRRPRAERCARGRQQRPRGLQQTERTPSETCRKQRGTEFDNFDIFRMGWSKIVGENATFSLLGIACHSYSWQI